MRYDPLVERRSSVVPAIVLGAMAIGGVLSLTTMLSAHPNLDMMPTAKIAPTSRWADRPITQAGFVMEVAEFTKAPPEYLAEIQPTTGNLRDTLILGDDRRFIRLTIQRQSTTPPQGTTAAQIATTKPADFYVEMVRRSADAGLSITHAGQPQIVESRFGKMEIADINLSGPQGALTCAGVRMGQYAPQFAISGMMCGMTLPLNLEKIACLTDRLELKDSDDADLIDIFTNADQTTVCKSPRIKPVKMPVAELVPTPAAPVVKVKKKKKA